MKKLIALILLSAMLITLISCNTNNIKETSSANSSSSETDDPNQIDYFYTTGYVIKTESAYFFVAEDENVSFYHDPIRMKNDWSGIDFDFLKSGDCVRIRLLVIQESAPLQAPVYELEFLGEGAEISDDIIAELQGYGYIIVP
ncbi:MAG: hypothetical protein IJ489_06560 [Clostridia bacterium]|nr:hypothetical protein [Clostridia bacterium]